MTVSEQCNQKIMAFREEERQDITNLKQEKLELLEKIDAMKEEHISLQMQIEKVGITPSKVVVGRLFVGED